MALLMVAPTRDRDAVRAAGAVSERRSPHTPPSASFHFRYKKSERLGTFTGVTAGW